MNRKIRILVLFSVVALILFVTLNTVEDATASISNNSSKILPKKPIKTKIKVSPTPSALYFILEGLDGGSKKGAGASRSQNKSSTASGRVVEPSRKLVSMSFLACGDEPPAANGDPPATSESMCGEAANTCNAPKTPPSQWRILYNEWSRWVSGPPAYALKGPWSFVGSVCVREGVAPPHANVPKRVVPPPLSWVNVWNAMREEKAPVKVVGVSPFPVTLVNYPTDVFTSGGVWSVDGLKLLGRTVDVVGTPSSYVWSFGDGQSLTTTSSGAAPPGGSIVHKYMRLAKQVRLSVAVTYRLRWRVDGHAWQQVPQTLTVPGPATVLRVKEIVPVLVGN